METNISSALIAVVVSAAGIVVSFLTSRWQIQQKSLELKKKKKELDRLGDRLQAEVYALRQTIMKDVLSRRMEAYAALWKVIITHGRNWWIEDKAVNSKWANDSLSALNTCNAEYGVFFSQRVYQPFYEYREKLVEIVNKGKSGETISRSDLLELETISTHGLPGRRSLSGAMKDDLGSYIDVAIQYSE